jgi:hypothetical protein
MQSWRNSVRLKINPSRLRRYWKRRGYLAAKNARDASVVRS